MHNLLERPWVEQAFRVFVFCGAGVFGIRLLQLHTESFLGMVFYIWFFPMIGLGIAPLFMKPIQYRYDTVRPSRLTILGRFMLYTTIAAYVGWLLWQPWLWLTK